MLKVSKKGNFKAKICKLIGNKFCYYRNENQKKVKGILDFDILSCTIEIGKENSNIFRILVFKSSKYFTFKASCQSDCQIWVKGIHKRIISSKGYQKNLTKVALQPLFWKYDRISQKDVPIIGDTGDIILFRSYGAMASIQRFFTCSYVGIL